MSHHSDHSHHVHVTVHHRRHLVARAVGGIVIRLWFVGLLLLPIAGLFSDRPQDRGFAILFWIAVAFVALFQWAKASGEKKLRKDAQVAAAKNAAETQDAAWGRFDDTDAVTERIRISH